MELGEMHVPQSSLNMGGSLFGGYAVLDALQYER